MPEPTASEATIRRGDEIELRLESAGFEGVSVGRVGKFVVFVPFAVPGDLVRVRIRRKRRKFAEATLLEVLEPSSERIEPRCRYFGSCGGCRWQNTPYENQLKFKRTQVIDLMERIGGLDGLEVEPTLAAPGRFYYRNKMEFSFGPTRWLTREEIESGQAFDREFALGLHPPRQFDRILDLEVCYLQSEISSQIVNWFRNRCVQAGWKPYDSKRRSGFLRNLVIREAAATGQILVNFVTTRRAPDRVEPLCREFIADFPDVTTFVHSVNEGRSPVALGDESVLHGAGYIEERIGPVRFHIHPSTFFQPNTRQAEQLYRLALEAGRLEPGQTVYDLYCGVGAIALFLSGRVAKVVGVESLEASVEAARGNADLNGIQNSFFHAGDCEEAFQRDFLIQQGAPDVVFLDPPRAGLGPKVLRSLLETVPPRIVYISCNPATQARDLKELSASYRIESVQPVDMFPQTPHIETVVGLGRRGDS